VTQTIHLFVATADKHTTDRVASLSRGSHIAVVGSGPLDEQSIQAIAAIRPQVCLINAREAEATYLAFARRMFKDVPDTKVVLFGPSDDRSVMARAAASNVKNYLSEYITYPEFIQLLTDAEAGKPPQVACIFGQTAAALPPRPTSPLSAPRLTSIVRQCSTLGLHADDIAWYLSTDIEVIRSHLTGMLRKTDASSRRWTRLCYGAIAAAVLLVAYKALVASWTLGSRRIAVSGHVQYAAQPLDNGVIEFRSTDSKPAIIAGAVIQDGVYRISDRKGLLPGGYVVMVFSPESTSTESSSALSGAAPPARERIPEQYNSSSTQRVEVRRLGPNVFDFDIPKAYQEPQGSGPTQQE